MDKPRVAVHKFSSCDGCQLAFLNLGEALLDIAGLVELVHFAEAGPLDPDARVDIAFVEGSINTRKDLERVQRIRANTGTLIAIGACATAGGLQALRNIRDSGDWSAAIYARPEWLDNLDTATPISAHVRVDLSLHGCPVSSDTLVSALQSLLRGIRPQEDMTAVCMACKRARHGCVMVTEGRPCMGPVTRTGCGALCPGMGRDCYGCYGPRDGTQPTALRQRLAVLGLDQPAIDRRFQLTHAGHPMARGDHD
jgi:coenzyme F420-reducing hydrogenase gamma subunit